MFHLSSASRLIPTVRALVVSLTTFKIAAAAPVVAGLSSNHPLDEAATGTLLVNELRCASCHDGISASKPPSAPVLDAVSSRVRQDFLINFIKNPAAHDPGTGMPNVLGTRTDEEREQIAKEITAFLSSLPQEASAPPVPDGSVQRGKEVFHEAGCISCHGVLDDPAVPSKDGSHVGLNHVGAKYYTRGLAAFLQDPLESHPSGRMPSMDLTRQESKDLAEYLVTRSAKPQVARKPVTETMAKAGHKAFFAMNCAACHQVKGHLLPPDGHKSTKPPAFKDLDLTQGCLSEAPADAPNYQLSETQRKAIRAALSKPVEKPEPEALVKQTLTALNCIACHKRDDYGGVDQSLDSYFHTTEEALGDSARIPPTLTKVGAKLRPRWMNKVFYDAERVRPYMKTRMPQYGPEALSGLTELFGECDQLEPFEFKEIDRQSNPMMRNGAHMLLGTKGLNCIACHNFNGKDSPGMKGLDLMTSYQRLQPAWFNQFMRNPASLRPGIIMPSFWPDGKAVQTEILNGNTEDQLRALWYNFSLGRSARDPEGLGAKDPVLDVTDTIRTYRGRSSVAGYRGIAVGFPGGVNYAFNAQNGSLSSIWLGDYVSVGWRGQGSGNFNPRGRAISLPNDVGFLQEPKDPWPLQPIRTKENPINPDPLYPRQHGYAFRGYSLGKDGRPTFRYAIGDVAIEDTSEALTDQTPAVLRRTLKFTTKSDAELYLRPLKGKIISDSEKSFKMDQLHLNITSRGPLSSALASGQLRPSADGDKELLLRFQLPPGTSTHTLEYVIQP